MKKYIATWSLPPDIKDRLGQKSAGRQRAMFADGHLLLILHQPATFRQSHREAVFFWRKPDGQWQSSLTGIGKQLIHQHLEAYQQATELLVTMYGRAGTADDYFQILEAIAPLYLASKNLHSTLQTAREYVPNDGEIIDWRDWAYDLERNLEILLTNTKNAMDFKIAKTAEEENRLSLEAVNANNRLNTLAAIFFPLTAVSCIFGMNLVSGLENTSPIVFWLILSGGICLGYFVRQWVLTGKFK